MNEPRAASRNSIGLDDNVYQALLQNRIIFLGSEVKDENANAICAQMLLLNAEDPQKDIYLYINSPGGSVDSGMAIYDTMNWISNDVATVAMGLAASMGQFLLCAGTKGKRYALPHSRIMMHQPSGGLGGTASDIRIQAEQSLHIKTVMQRLIAEHTGQTLDQIEADSDRDRWFTAEDAQRLRPDRPRVRLGCADPLARSPQPVKDRVPMTTPFGAPVPMAQSTQFAPTMDYYIPQWEERTSYGMRRIDPYTKLFEDRIIFLGTPISDEIANAVMAQLLCLQQMDADRDIEIYINSPGGSFTALTAIYDTMRYVKPDVRTVCLGQAASAAAVILAAGTKGKRLALPNSRILIHQPATEGGYGQSSDIEIQAREILRIRSLMEDMLATDTGKSVDEISHDIERDKYLTAEQALEYGIIDEVLTSLKALPV